MAKYYELLSGEKIELSRLKKDAREHVSKIEKMIANSEDYYKVLREHHKLWEGEYYNLLDKYPYWTPETAKKLEDSPHYKITYDLILRYEKKCFSSS